MSDKPKLSIKLGKRQARKHAETPPDDDTGSENGDAPGAEAPVDLLTLKTWASGDWREVPRSSPPFNGLRITAEYGTGTAPEGVLVTFDDYTCKETGVSTVIPKLTVSDGWVPVPQPAIEKGSTQQTFTVTGKVCIQSELNGKFLRITLSYGLENMERDERGFIFSVG